MTRLRFSRTSVRSGIRDRLGFSSVKAKGESPTRILVLGGGYIGLYCALGLEKRLRPDEATITLVSPESFMLYQSFLPEAASGNIEPRHVVVPLRQALRRTQLITGWVARLDHAKKAALVEPIEGPPRELNYDVVVIGLGSVSRVLDVPGLAEHGIGFKEITEAIYLRNKILSCLDVAESTTDPAIRERALTFLFVGGGYAGVEALGELEDLARDAARRFHTVDRADMRWVLVEAADSILPEIGKDLGDYAVHQLRLRDIEVHLGTRLESAEGGRMRLSNGIEFDGDTLVWTTGVKANPVVTRMGFDTDERGRLIADEYLRVRGSQGAWTGGDCAAVPDLVTGGTCPPTAQYSLREARRMAANIAASLQGKDLEPFRYRNLGTLVSLGRYKGVARVLGVKLKGLAAWVLHRSYHLARVPTFNRKVRIALDWTVALFFRRDIAQLGSLVHPRDAFSEASSDVGEGKL
jgi:NADH:ubiquinone reductase (H+-translocating)